MAAPPLVSVLIPSYNHGAYIGQTIASVLNQTAQDLELLIIDDGSTDDSPAIIEALARQDRRIRWWSQANAGLIPTLNRLASLARGAFVAQIDSDDQWLPERLAWGLEDMAEDPSLSVSFCSYLRIDGGGVLGARTDQLKLGTLAHDALLKRLVVKNTVCACTGFMRRQALDRIGPFARDYSLSHDWDRWLRLSLVGRLHMRASVGALYRDHGANQSMDIAGTRKQELAILDSLAEILIGHHHLDDAVRLEMYGRAAALAFDTQQPDRLVAYLMQKHVIYPLFEHEQVWLLHRILQEKLMPTAQETAHKPALAAAHAGLFNAENQQRWACIMAL